MQVDTVTVLIQAVDMLLTQDPPPRLDPATGQPRPKETAAEKDAPPVGDGWLFNAFGSVMLQLLDSSDPVVRAVMS